VGAAIANKLRPWSQRAFDDALGSQTNEMLDWLVGSMNQLIGQVSAPPTTGQGALFPNTINPTTNTIQALGGRVTSLATGFTYTADNSAAINLYWDGTNSSQLLRIYRDDGTVSGPFSGNAFITGLLPATTYFFYPYFDEAAQVVKFVSQEGAVGDPPIAYLATAPQLAQAQFLRGRIPLATNLSGVGILTPAGAPTTPTLAGGGGGGGGVYYGRYLP